MKLLIRTILLLSFLCFTISESTAQCNQTYNWTTWQNFTGQSASGIINYGSQTVNVTMTANYSFGSTPGIFNYPAFNGFNSVIPNSTVPSTTWSFGVGGSTTMCFNQTVSNPVLLISSLGAPNLSVTLNFSLPFIQLYNGGGMSYPNNTTAVGTEGYAILLFPGNFNCVSIFSTTAD